MSTRARAAALVAALILLAAGPASATTYRWVDTRGVTNYADRPRDESLLRDAVPVHGEDDTDGGQETRAPARGTTPPAPGPDALRLPPPPKEPLARELMRLAGLDEQLALLSRGARAEASGLGWRLRGRGGAAHAATLAFGPEWLRRHAEAAIASRLPHSHAGAAMAWLRSPLSRRITALELRAWGDEQAEAYGRFVDALPAAPPPPHRIGLVQRADRAGDVTEASYAAATAVRAAVGQVIAPERNVPFPDAPVFLPAGVDERMRLRTVIGMLFAYRELSDADLGRAVAFWEAPAGRWTSRLLQAAVHEAIRAARTEAARAAGHDAR